jgi:hypothetical protein
MHGASIALVLLDTNDVPISAGTAETAIQVEGGVLDLPAVAVPLEGLSPAGAPSKVLVGFATLQTGRSMSRLWLSYVGSAPRFPIASLLAGDDPAVWHVGLDAIADEVRDHLIRGRDPYDTDAITITRVGWDRVRRVVRPHVDRLAGLFPLVSTRAPHDLPALCRLAGDSGDARFIALLKPWLDEPRVDVADSAAIGLGLLGEATAAPRLRAIAARPLPGQLEADQELETRKHEAARALQVLGAR